MPDKTTITIDGVEYVRADTRTATSADIKIVRANRGYRDYIYVGPVTVTLWRRDVRDGPQTRLFRVTIADKVPTWVHLGVIPADACGGQWDVRAADGTWLAGKQWQLPSCGGPTSTTTTTTPPTSTTTTSTSSTTTSPTTEPTTTTTTTAPTSSTTTTQPTTSTTTSTTTEPTWTTTAPPTTTSPPTNSTSSTATSTSSGPTATSSTSGSGTSTQPQRPPTTPASNTPLPSTGGNAWVGFVAPIGLLVMAAGMGAVAWSNRRDGKYRR